MKETPKMLSQQDTRIRDPLLNKTTKRQKNFASSDKVLQWLSHVH